MANPVVAVVAVPGCMGSAVVGTMEAIGVAQFAGGGGPTLEGRVVSLTGETVTAFGGFPLKVDGRMRDLERADAVVIPPILSEPAPSFETHQETIHWLQRMSERGSVACAVCTGTYLLAETGLLNNRRATTTPSTSDVFRHRFPEVDLDTTVRLADEGTVVTAGATTSFLDLAINLIGRFAGPDVALLTAKALATDLNPRSQQPYLLPRPRFEHVDSEVRVIQRHIEENYADKPDFAKLARSAGMSSRTFGRRFRAATGTSPQEYLQMTRIEAAMRDLESTQLSIEQITRRCGYQDPRSFRRLFAKHAGLPPRAHRDRFGYVALE